MKLYYMTFDSFRSCFSYQWRLYSGSEASDVVFQYVEKENLVKPTDKSTVVLDPPLCDALFKGAIKKGSTYHNVIHKKDLGSTFWQDAATPFGKKGHEVLIQGGKIDDVARLLVEHYAIPMRYIEVMDKTRK
ncbi:unnamed protein product [Linum tenue]|uniref:eIF2D SWIB domain-containing protein n=1 Tax=Linum tenue TaxID=586396 RepID=A0AAV0NKR6_9ROSI|nr:unnamed protein product [Linum tenue]